MNKTVKRKYHELWIADKLADFLGEEPLRMRKYFDRIYFIKKLFANLWPVIGTAILAIALDDIKNNTSKFIDILTSSKHFIDYEFDFWTTAYVVISFWWLYIFLKTILTEDKRAAAKFEKINSVIIRAPNMNTFQSARTTLDQTFSLLRDIEKYKEEFKIALFKNESLLEFFLALNVSLIGLARKFFNTETITGANFMIFFEKNDENEIFINTKLSNVSKLCYVNNNEANELGTLYLAPQLGIDVEDKNRIYNRLLLPVYDPKKNVYETSIDIGIVPGAPLAFVDHSSMVGDTKNVKKFYGNFSNHIQSEIGDYFKKDSQRVRSFASFSVPSSVNPSKIVAVFNLDSEISYSFGEDEEFFSTFYTMIYPTLTIISEYIQYCRVYLMDLLTNPEKYAQSG